MASGTNKYKYQTDKGNIFYARTDDSPQLTNIRGEEPTGAVTESMTFKVSRASKETLYLKTADTFDGCLINPNTVVKKVVILKNDHNVTQGQEITVNGRTFIVGPITSEQMR